MIGLHVSAAFRGRDLVVTHHRVPVHGGVPLDITDRTAVRALIQRTEPDVVVLAAAEAHVERCQREPAATRAINVEAAQSVAGACGGVDALLVVFSSEYVFDGTKGRYTEDDPVAPINEYGRQKVELEAVARGLRRHLICRTSGVFGWEAARKNFVCQVIDRLRSGRQMIVPSDQLITPTDAADLAHTLAALVERDTHGTIHLVGPRIVERTVFAASICRVFGLPADRIVARPTEDLGLAAPRPRKAGLADDRLRHLLGMSLRDPEDGLAYMRRNEEVQLPGPVQRDRSSAARQS